MAACFPRSTPHPYQSVDFSGVFLAIRLTTRRQIQRMYIHAQRYVTQVVERSSVVHQQRIEMRIVIMRPPRFERFLEPLRGEAERQQYFSLFVHMRKNRSSTYLLASFEPISQPFLATWPIDRNR